MLRGLIAAFALLFAAFMADPEWAAIKRGMAARHGQPVGDVEDRVLILSDYSRPPG